MATASNGGGDLEQLLVRLEELVTEIETYDDEVKGSVFEFLDGIDLLHRGALHRLGAVLGTERVAELCREEPTVAWLFDAYGVGVDERQAAEDALAEVAVRLRQGGGDLELLDVDAGVVRVRLRGAPGATDTLAAEVEEVLRRRVSGFVGLHVDDQGEGQDVPGAGLLQIEDRPPGWVPR